MASRELLAVSLLQCLILERPQLLLLHAAYTACLFLCPCLLLRFWRLGRCLVTVMAVNIRDFMPTDLTPRLWETIVGSDAIGVRAGSDLPLVAAIPPLPHVPVIRLCLLSGESHEP